MSTATTTQTPAERIRPGKGIQVINATNPDGTFYRQVRCPGMTETQARAYVTSLATHR